jgi:hypothetical protein
MLYQMQYNNAYIHLIFNAEEGFVFFCIIFILFKIVYNLCYIDYKESGDYHVWTVFY